MTYICECESSKNKENKNCLTRFNNGERYDSL